MDASISDNPFEHVRIRTVLWWYLLSTPIAGLLYVLILILDPPREIKGNLGIALMVTWAYGTLVGWMYFQSRRRSIRWNQLWRPEPENCSRWRILALVVPVVAMAWGLVLCLLGLATFMAPKVLIERLVNDLIAMQMDRGQSTILDYLFLFLGGALVAPLIEEFFFRGFLLNRWSAKWGVRKAVVYSSLVFMAAHVGNPTPVILGLAVALLYVRTRTLIVPVAFHAVNNVVALIGGSFFATMMPIERATVAEMRIDALVYGLPALMLGTIWLGIFAWRAWPPRDATPPYFSSERSVATPIDKTEGENHELSQEIHEPVGLRNE